MRVNTVNCGAALVVAYLSVQVAVAAEANIKPVCITLSTDQQLQDAVNDGTIVEYCPPGEIEEKITARCIPVTGDGDTMPYYNKHCTSPMRCNGCYSILGVQIDKECSPTQAQTCKCRDSSKILVTDDEARGVYCVQPTTNAPIVSSYTTSQLFDNTTEPDTDPNECISDPCQNDGTCVDELNGFICLCASGWEGTLCQEHTSCKSNPCFNTGTCIPHYARYFCNCSSGFFGIHCEQKLDKSSANNEDTFSAHIIIVVLGGICGILLTFIVCCVVVVVIKRKKGKPAESEEQLPVADDKSGENTEDGFCSPVTRKHTDELVAASRPVLPSYPRNKHYGTVLTVYDESREYVEEDIPLTENISKFVIGDHPRNVCKKIMATSDKNVMTEVKKISKMDDLGDMLICFILCHGGKKGFRCGSQYLDPGCLVKMFYSTNCPALVNKPKIFICLHCRGVDALKPLTSPSEEDDNGVIPAGDDIFCNEMSDILIIHSAWPTTQAFIGRMGSWLLLDLYKALRHYPQEDFEAVLTEMKRLVVERVGPHGTTYVKQQPVVLSTLSKRIPMIGRKEQRQVREMENSVQVTNGTSDNEDHLLDEATGGSSTHLLAASGSSNHADEVIAILETPV